MLTQFNLIKAAGKSLFAQKRELNKLKSQGGSTIAPENVAHDKKLEDVKSKQILLDEIHENMLGDVRGSKVDFDLINNVVGEIVERREGVPRQAAKEHQLNQVSANINKLCA